ncbi:sugar kinase [Caulobacter sp. S45]|uniref:sugar kinase n=1 Tax=Caulobacter sp. S45 TaxID=1641861 RepID=UPI00131D4BA0|nr:sugar kinase [Caulobacter sp. S45]
MAEYQGSARVSATVACFGELMLRLAAPDSELLLQSGRLLAQFGGAEANVGVSLAHFGHRVRAITVLPDNPIGEAALGELRRHGVDTSFLKRRPGRMGIYFLTPGAVLRPSEVLYDRAGSAFAETGADEYDFETALAGCDWLHLSGITPAVSPQAAAAALAAVRMASRLGVKVSFDGNYRAKLWAAWGGDARPVLKELVSHADLLFGDDRDVALILERSFDDPDPTARRTAAAQVAFDAFPRLQQIACTLRTEHAVCRQALSGFMATRQGVHRAPELTLEGVVDRIGTGDAFAAGVLHGLTTGMEAERALRFGLAAAAFKHSTPGDFSPARLEDIEAGLSETGLHVRR